MLNFLLATLIIAATYRIATDPDVEYQQVVAKKKEKVRRIEKYLDFDDEDDYDEEEEEIEDEEPIITTYRESNRKSNIPSLSEFED